MNKSSFFSKYCLLTALQKRLFKLMQWYARKHPALFMAHQTLADHLKCKRETVCRMLKKFLLYGWIKWRSRGKWDTNEYTLPKELIELDLSNNHRFRRDSITPSITPNTMNRKNPTSKGNTGSSYTRFGKGKPPPTERIITIPERIDRLNLPYEIKLKLSMVPESYFQSALDSAKWKKAHGYKINDPNNYVAGSAIKMAKKQGVKLDWPAFYSSMKNYYNGKPT